MLHLRNCRKTDPNLARAFLCAPGRSGEIRRSKVETKGTRTPKCFICVTVAKLIHISRMLSGFYTGVWERGAGVRWGDVSECKTKVAKPLFRARPSALISPNGEALLFRTWLPPSLSPTCVSLAWPSLSTRNHFHAPVWVVALRPLWVSGPVCQLSAGRCANLMN